MRVLQRLERKLFLGEVLRDYGVLRQHRDGMTVSRTNLLLCRKQGRLQLVLRATTKSPIAANVHYDALDVTPETIAVLKAAITDLEEGLARGEDAPPGESSE